MPLTQIGGVDFTRVDTTQQHALNIEVQDRRGNWRKYVRAGAAIAAGDILKQDLAESISDYDPTSAVNQIVLGIAERAVANNSFFWMLTQGESLIVKATAGTTAGATLGSSAVAGTVITLTCAGANPTQAEAQAYNAAMGGRSLVCTVTEAAGVAGVYIS